jgi:hypothetical protein
MKLQSYGLEDIYMKVLRGIIYVIILYGFGKELQDHLQLAVYFHPAGGLLASLCGVRGRFKYQQAVTGSTDFVFWPSSPPRSATPPVA